MSSTNIPSSKKAWEGLKNFNWKEWGECGQIYLKEIQAWGVVGGIKSARNGPITFGFRGTGDELESMQVKGLVEIHEMVGL